MVMSTYRRVAYIVIGSILGALAAAVLPGMETGVAIAIGAGVGVAVSSAGRRVAPGPASDRPVDHRSNTPAGE
ncbi:MAG: hypothetical protein QOJ35_2720 [Solirubrobacteraceae bacterium]|nr:hypothetical protein [Solirubrobacteraceae bacterium]